MNWIDYVRVLQEFRARYGRMPSSMLTDDGALGQMQEALGESAEKKRASSDGSNLTARHGIRQKREQGH